MAGAQENDEIYTFNKRPPSEISGWVERRTALIFVRRWVELTRSRISYYRSDEDSEPLGALELVADFGVQVGPRDVSTVTLRSGGDDMELRFASLAERDRWLAALARADGFLRDHADADAVARAYGSSPEAPAPPAEAPAPTGLRQRATARGRRLSGPNANAAVDGASTTPISAVPSSILPPRSATFPRSGSRELAEPDAGPSRAANSSNDEDRSISQRLASLFSSPRRSSPPPEPLPEAEPQPEYPPLQLPTEDSPGPPPPTESAPATPTSPHRQRSPPWVRYRVAIRTGTERGAGTDANVYLELHGERGSTPRTHLALDARGRPRSACFRRGSLDEFAVLSPDLGELAGLALEHDNTGFGAGWFVEEVVVRLEAASVPAATAAPTAAVAAGEAAEVVRQWAFPARQWLATDEGDGRTRRLLRPWDPVSVSPPGSPADAPRKPVTWGERLSRLAAAGRRRLLGGRTGPALSHASFAVAVAPFRPKYRGRRMAGTLRATVVEARGLKIGAQTSDAYVVARCEGRELRTSVRMREHRPQWHEELVFPVQEPTSLLTLAVWDHFKIGPPELMGCACVPLALDGALLSRRVLDRWYELGEAGLQRAVDEDEGEARTRRSAAGASEAAGALRRATSGPAEGGRAPGREAAGGDGGGGAVGRRARGKLRVRLQFDYDRTRYLMSHLTLPIPDPRDPRAKPDPFRIKLFKVNYERFNAALVRPIARALEFRREVLEWRSPTFTLICFFIYMYLVFHGNLVKYVVPLLLLFKIAWRAALRYWEVPEGAPSGPGPDPAGARPDSGSESEEAGTAAPGAPPRQAPGRRRGSVPRAESRNLVEKLQHAQEQARKVQNFMGGVASGLEKLENLFNFTVPWKTYAAGGMLLIYVLVLLLLPARYIWMLVGLHQFTTKFRVPGNVVVNMIARFPPCSPPPLPQRAAGCRTRARGTRTRRSRRRSLRRSRPCGTPSTSGPPPPSPSASARRRRRHLPLSIAVSSTQ